MGSLFDGDLGKSKRPRLPISSASILGRNPLRDNNLRPDRVFGHNEVPSDARPAFVQSSPLERSLSGSAELIYLFSAAFRRAAQYAFMRLLCRFLSVAVSLRLRRATGAIPHAAANAG